VALLLRDREAANSAATPPPGNGASAVVPDFACETCGAGMQRGQDWCLECGTAARGRLGAKGGWRAAFTIVSLVLLLVFGAGIAGYAALTTDAERTASAPTQGDGNPITAQTPVAPGVPGVPGPDATTITPGETGPGTTPPAVTQQIPPGTAGAPGVVQTPPATGPRLVIPPTKPSTPATNQTLPPGVGTGSTGTTGATGAGTTTKPPTGTATGTTAPSTGTTAPAAKPQIITLKAGAAKTYDPGARVGAEVGPAANAIDGKPGTVWDVTVPADGNPLGVGILVDLGAPYALQSLRIATNTPGYKAEIYGAVDAKEIPADLIDKRWQHLTDSKSVEDGAPILLKGKGQAPKFQLVLIYPTTPGEPTDPRAAIGELTLRGTP
jgi:hypothetical protein